MSNESDFKRIEARLLRGEEVLQEVSYRVSKGHFQREIKKLRTLAANELANGKSPRAIDVKLCCEAYTLCEELETWINRLGDLCCALGEFSELNPDDPEDWDLD